jgi:nicotinamidase-related amidase
VVAGRHTGTRRELPGSAAEAAVLVVDVQRSFADPTLYCPQSPVTAAAVEGAVGRVAVLVDGAREAGVAVVWIRLEQSTH